MPPLPSVGGHTTEEAFITTENNNSSTTCFIEEGEGLLILTFSPALLFDLVEVAPGNTKVLGLVDLKQHA